MDDAPPSLNDEFLYRYRERIALLCPNGETPTAEHEDMARREGWEAVNYLRIGDDA